MARDAQRYWVKPGLEQLLFERPPDIPFNHGQKLVAVEVVKAADYEAVVADLAAANEQVKFEASYRRAAVESMDTLQLRLTVTERDLVQAEAALDTAQAKVTALEEVVGVSERNSRNWYRLLKGICSAFAWSEHARRWLIAKNKSRELEPVMEEAQRLITMTSQDNDDTALAEWAHER